jgi:type II secretory pathway pseudopilin PulG
MKRNQRQCGRLNAECGKAPAPTLRARLPRSPFPLQHSAFNLQHSRPALTLIELLVTIAILVTVLGAVVPMLSPNNDARKIREAARQLNGMFAQAQAQAARDGRAVGVAFQEFTTDSTRSGMALEAFFISEPPPFAGFSESSRAEVTTLAGSRYVDPNPPDERVEFERYRGNRLCQIRLCVLSGDGTSWENDPWPPSLLRVGDTVKVAGNEFLIVEEDYPKDSGANRLDINGYLDSTPEAMLLCVWTNDSGQPLPGPPVVAEPSRKSFVINRRPRNSAGAPMQFPTGIGIDMDVSGAEGPHTRSSFDSGGTNVVGIMFAPNGTLYALYYDGKLEGSVEKVYLHLGRFENGNNGNQNRDDYDFANNPAQSTDDMEDRRERLNWLNADSRWVAVNRAGRIVTAENAIFDPHADAFTDKLQGDSDQMARTQQRRQINAAREYAEQMANEGGR